MDCHTMRTLCTCCAFMVSLVWTHTIMVKKILRKVFEKKEET